MNIAKALEYGRPGEKWSLFDNDYTKLTWVENTEKPTEQEIATWWAAVNKTTIKSKIDRQAEVERLKYITPGAGQAGVYLQKAAEAKAALADLAPQASDYPLLAASIGIDGANVSEVATTVQTIASTWTAVAAHIENVRLTAKKAIDDGSDPDTVLSNIDWSLP